MLYVGTRDEPSLKSLLLVVVLVVLVAIYAIVAISTDDWLWFFGGFSETPTAVVVHCYGETIKLQPGSAQFNTLAKIMNETMSGKKRWDSLTLSKQTYQDYQTDLGSIVIEFFYPASIRIHSGYKFYSNVDNLVIPLEGRHAQTNAVFGQNRGVATAGSFHVRTTKQLKDYLRKQVICPNAQSTGD